MMMMPVDGRVAATELDDLPEEIVVGNILVRLPAKDVGRCRVVRASWHSATSTPDFMLAHYRHQPSLPIVEREYRLGLFRDTSGRAYYQALWPNLPNRHCVRLHTASDGFVVVSLLSRFFICNPTIHQIVPLAQPEFQPTNTILGLYRHDATGEYRVLWSSLVDCTRKERMLYVITVGDNQPRSIRVRVSTMSLPSQEQVRVSTMSSPSQEQVRVSTMSSPSQEQALLEGLPRDPYSAYNPPVHHRGNLHWMSTCRAQIIVFDTATELFSCMRRATNSDCLEKLFDVEGKLGLCSPDKPFTYMDVWVMEDYKAEIWEFKYRIDMSSIEASRSLALTSLKKEKRKRTVTEINPMMRILSEMTMLNDRELLIGYNDKHVLRCKTDGKILGMANIGKREYNMELTQHRLKESIIPIPSSEIQEESQGVSILHRACMEG